MTYINSSNRVIDFTIPDDINEYYEMQIEVAKSDKRKIVKILPEHLEHFGLDIEEFRNRILRHIVDTFEITRAMTNNEKRYFIRFRAKLNGS